MANLHQGINSFLQNWRDQNNYSHHYAASLLGITEPVYILWENGGDRPDPSTFSRIVEIVNSSPDRVAGTDLNPPCPAVLARQSMLEAKQAYDALPDDTDPGLLRSAETACQASENLLCQATARSIPGLRAQIEELMNRCMLDEHETQAEATRMLFDNILAGLEGFHVARDSGRPANKLA